MEQTVNGITDLSKTINDYGPFAVILAVVLIILIILIVYLLKENRKAIASEREQNNELIKAFMDNYFDQKAKSIEKDYDEKNIVDIFIKLNKSLKNACDLTLDKTKSNRTAIYVFHNGSHASHGLPFFKMSCISEKVSKDSAKNILMAEHSAMPLTLFDSIVSSLYDYGEYRITLDQTNDPSDLIFLKGSRIKDCLFIPIYDTDDNMMGFIFNGYNTINPDRDIQKEKLALIELAMMAKPVIQFSNYQEYQSNNNEGE